MRLNELRELIQLVLLEDETPKKKKRAAKKKKPKEAPPPREEVILSVQDIMRVLETNSGKKAYSNLHGVTIYAPYHTRETLPAGDTYDHLRKLIPFDVVSTVKYDSVSSKDSKGKLLTLKAEEGAPGAVIEAMASRIEYALRNEESIAAVTCVDSSHGMSAALADAVAAKLNVPYQPIVKKTMDINLTWDPDQWAAYEHMIRSTGLNGNGDVLTIKVDGKKTPVTRDEYLDAAKAVLANELKYAKNLIRAGKKPTMAGGTNVDTGHKRFWNFFDKVARGDLAPGSKVLVVDDNVDSGWTPYHVAKRCREAGLEPLFAVGFKMMRYAVKKAPAASISPMMTGLDKKPIDDLARLADEFAGHLFKVGNLLMAMSDNPDLGVQAADVFEVMKASSTGVELKDIDTSNTVWLNDEDLAPDQANIMWDLAA